MSLYVCRKQCGALVKNIIGGNYEEKTINGFFGGGYGFRRV